MHGWTNRSQSAAVTSKRDMSLIRAWRDVLDTYEPALSEIIRNLPAPECFIYPDLQPDPHLPGTRIWMDPTTGARSPYSPYEP